ncbi:MAG: hypothetical protein JKY95_13815 [Planctomycetaceae bacterium]|nr:hypothetical protein [Planctomycetaceae bacterium]
MQRDQVPMGARIIAGCFGLTFGGIGLSLFAFMWLTPFNQFGSPPLFFRVFASLIAIPFMAIGFTGLYSAITGTGAMTKHHLLHGQIMRAAMKNMKDQTAGKPGPPTQLACPSCGAPRSSEEASPSGDVKCAHCQRWYNMYSGDGA